MTPGPPGDVILAIGMTEHEWRTCDDPGPMLDYLHGRASERKLRLFACACCRRIPSIDGVFLAGVEVAERFADGLATEDEADAAEEAAVAQYAQWGNDEEMRAVKGALDMPRHYCEPIWPAVSSSWAAECHVDYRGDLESYDAQRRAEYAVQADLLRDVIGNPFATVSFDPAWRSPEAVSLADSMYESRDFGRMSELAAALERAGCTENAVLGHCRGPGLHVRGCWVVDSILSRA